MNSAFGLAMKFLRRDWREGEWRVLFLALVLAVGSLATVGMFADRIGQGLDRQAASLLGADLRITSTRPIPEGYRRSAALHGLRSVESLVFPSMVSHREKVLLAEIEAVEEGYPLRGRIQTDGAAQGIPARGTVWADDRLMRRLGLKRGSEVGIGNRRFTVAAMMVKDVGQTMGFGSFAPRVMMNQADVASTGLVQNGSRITYRMLFAGGKAGIAAFRKSLGKDDKVEDVTDARPEIRTTLERAGHFLGLAALTSAMLAGVAIMLASRRYVSRHMDSSAVLRCLGAKRSQVRWIFLHQFWLSGVLAVIFGILLAYALQGALVSYLMPDADLPWPGAMPAFKAAVSGLALLFGFAYLPLARLSRVSPMRVMRREAGLPPLSGWLVYGAGGIVLCLLFLWQAGTVKLGFAVLGGLILGLAADAALVQLLLRALARLAGGRGVARQAFRNLARHSGSVALQVVMLSLGGMALLVLTLVRGDLLQSWQDKLPPDAPNRFLVGIQPGQKQSVLDFFASHRLPEPVLLPMVKGRLVAIDGREISGSDYPEPKARALVEREFNLSYAEHLPSWNAITGGKWWGGDRGRKLEETALFSVEEGLAKTLGIRLGDRLTYDVAGTRLTARVTNLRRVQWDSMRVNFFVIATPELLENYPPSYLTSFHLPMDRAGFGGELAEAFPNLLIIDMDAVISQIRDIISKVSRAISAVFLFTLLSGLVVLYAALLATQDERVRQAAILRVLGAGRAYLDRLHMAEFALSGALAGLLAAASAALLGFVLAHRVLDMPYRSGMSVWLVGIFGGMALVMLAGWLNTRSLVSASPLPILRGE